MSFSKNITLVFWDDAILFAMYVKNICPSHTLGKGLLVECGMDAILQ